MKIEPITPHLVRITLGGAELEGFPVPDPGASVRLLVPSPGADELVIPQWNGNEFLLPGGVRPIIRTFTPRYFRPDVLELDLDVVVHQGGAVSAWAAAAGPGDPAAVSGPGRGYSIDPEAPSFMLAGDETAIPAIAQLLEAIPPTVPAQVLIEVARPDARIDLPDHPKVTVEWLDLPAGEAPGAALVPAFQRSDLSEGTKVWVAGEAAAMHKIRQYLFKERGLPRSEATVRGYWKRREGGAD